MSNATASHPTSEALSAYGLGKLTDPETEVIARHLTTCADCRRLVEGLPADSLVGLVRSTKQATLLPAADPAHAPTGPGLEQSQLSGPAEPLPPTPADLPPELAEHPRYRIVRVLGRGGMGVVYEAEHRHMGRKVALKVISQSLVDRPEAVERFNREMHAAAKLIHPNIVTAFDAEQAGSLHLLVMEYVPGQSLAQVVEKKGPLPVAHACHFVRQAALGLQHAFEQGMVHRDLKPHNLMVTPKGQVKILDFGLARLAAEKKVGPGLTAEDAVMGTPEYLAPEQALDARQADLRADIYSLGCTLYCLLAGQPPFPDGTAMQKIMAHLEKQARPLPEVRADVPADLWAVVERMLAKDPAARYQQPVEVAQALVPFIKAGAKPAAGVAAPPPGASAAGAGTLLGGDTSKVLKKEAVLPKPPLPPAPVKEGASPFENLPGSAALSKKARPAGKSAPAAWYRRPPVLAAVSGAVLALGLGVWLLAGIVVKVPTKDGTLVIEVNVPNAEVYLNGKKAVVTWDNGGKRAEVYSKPGTYQVEVKKEGFTVHGEKVTLDEGGQRVLTAKLEKLSAPAQAGGGFVPLFNGKDLTGWEGLGYWSVEDGAIVGSTHPGGVAFNTFLCSQKTYKDFELSFQVRLRGEWDKANSGVQIRSEITDREKFIVKGPQADMGQYSWGSLYGEASGGMMKAADPGLVARVLRRDGFNEYYIKCAGKHVTIKLNGETTVDDDFPNLPDEGIIAWQLHSGPPMEVIFKDIRFQDLSKGGAADGFVPLFNGKDLTGWTVNEGGNMAVWGAGEGILYTEHRGGGWLMTDREYADFEVHVEFRVFEKTNSGVALRSPTKGDPAFVGMEIQILDDESYKRSLKGLRDDQLTGAIYDVVAPARRALKPVGEWNMMTIIASGRQVSVTLNGVKVVDANLDDYRHRTDKHPGLLRDKGHLGLQSHTGRVEFRQIEIKELPPPVSAPPMASVTPSRVSTSSGLEYQDLKVGTGEAARTGDTVVVHYTGWLARGDKKFDSSVDRNTAFEFTLGAGKVIKGWEEGVAGMKIGGKRKLMIPAKLAYGHKGAGGAIPPDADLIFEVELLRIGK